jgi:uncharacterized protein DUF6647
VTIQAHREPTFHSRAGSLSLCARGRKNVIGRHIVALLIASTITVSSASTCFSQSEPDRGSPVQQDNTSHSTAADAATLAATDIAWIASKTGWKKNPVPIIKRTSTEEMAKLFFGSADGINGIRPLALYDKEQHALYLAYEIDLNALLGRSILVHELVHHLQTVNEVEFKCPEAAEAQAYQLQGEWLREHGIKDTSSLIGFSEMELNSLGCF